MKYLSGVLQVAGFLLLVVAILAVAVPTHSADPQPAPMPSPEEQRLHDTIAELAVRIHELEKRAMPKSEHGGITTAASKSIVGLWLGRSAAAGKAPYISIYTTRRGDKDETAVGVRGGKTGGAYHAALVATDEGYLQLIDKHGDAAHLSAADVRALQQLIADHKPKLPKPKAAAVERDHDSQQSVYDPEWTRGFLRPAAATNTSDRNYVCPECGWSVWDDGGMNSSGTYEPMVAWSRISNHLYDHADGTLPGPARDALRNDRRETLTWPDRPGTWEYGWSDYWPGYRYIRQADGTLTDARGGHEKFQPEDFGEMTRWRLVSHSIRPPYAEPPEGLQDVIPAVD